MPYESAETRRSDGNESVVFFRFFLLYLAYEITSRVLRDLWKAAYQALSNRQNTPLLFTNRRVQAKSIQKTGESQTEREITTYKISTFTARKC